MTVLTPATEKFILHWGEMGQKWGINRSVAQVHALLYLSQRPLTAEEISDTLSLARSNVSTSIKELQGWGIVHLVPVMGDRRDHFEGLSDVWEMFQIILDERKRREIDPTVRVLAVCLADARRERGKDASLAADRLASMLEFFETMSTWYGQIRRLPQGAVIRFVKMGRKVQKLLGV